MDPGDKAPDTGPPAFQPHHFARLDEAPDEIFYDQPRLVTHIDDAACAALAGHYRRILRDGDRILDLMSSWVSHLPESLRPGHVTGHGMNAAELRANPRLDAHFLQNLNENPVLPFEDARFDACLLAVSVQYLTDPVAVLREAGRVIRPGGRIAISFSNRMFPTKAVALWRALGDSGHGELVSGYLALTGRFAPADIVDLSPNPGRSDPLWVVDGIRL